MLRTSLGTTFPYVSDFLGTSSLKFPCYPFERMPCSPTPVDSWSLTLALPGLLPSAERIASAFSDFHLLYPSSTTTHISGLYLTAYVLTPSSFTRPLLALRVDFATDLLVRL